MSNAPAKAVQPVPVVRPKPAATLIAGGFVLAALAAAFVGFQVPGVAMVAGILAVACLAMGVYRIVSAVDAIAAERYNSTIR